MSRHIEKQKILNFCKSVVNKEFVGAFNAFAEYVNTLPTIDIVHCSECKYNSICNRGVQHTTRDMSSVTIGYKSVDFCSYGERKVSEKPTSSEKPNNCDTCRTAITEGE